MKQIDLIYRTMTAELGQRLLDASFSADFPVEGRFVRVNNKGRKYWYFDQPGEDEGYRQKRRYVGPADDPEINKRVEDFRAIKDDAKGRRKLVTTLVREAGLPAPEPFSGDVVEALAHAGIFRLRACLVGTVAFSTYAGHLGVRLPAASMMTSDADFAQDYAISAEIGDSLPPILEILQGVDPTFRPIPHRSGSPRSTAFKNRAGYKVEFLTGNRGSDDYLDKPADMPALGGASADPLRFMDFLIYEPVRAVLLHKSGISVIVPAPERYAVHKLIVASRRVVDTIGAAKREKDLRQAILLFDALNASNRLDDLSDALKEAWERGEAWRHAIQAGMGYMPRKEKAATAALFRELGINHDIQ
ncbi:nucleotidyltransferase family protein [Sinorhizobium terangae]|uniref:nucleotidyltransferase family protein n=1 Tax=Sinorhizobium terangae TaxID=110322 RepID=UPI0024B047C5|nr:GSU2403 family nucleotidyltransferase fold protein [Sinorhizobium terangae]WFU51600.1 GSU2403 family nucleotidyltransferase fold protein [Sinorhizobium terangae]